MFHSIWNHAFSISLFQIQRSCNNFKLYSDAYFNRGDAISRDLTTDKTEEADTRDSEVGTVDSGNL